MILDEVPYFHMDGEGICSTSACLAMMLSFLGASISPVKIGDDFAEAFMSQEFRYWHSKAYDTHRISESEMLSCAMFLIDRKFKKFKADIIKTSIASIPLSYVKRRIPVAIVGRFPLLSGSVQNTIVIHGYVGRYLITHDPRGNANTAYTDRSGQNTLYHTSNLARWCGLDDVLLLRVLPEPDPGRIKI